MSRKLNIFGRQFTVQEAHKSDNVKVYDVSEDNGNHFIVYEDKVECYNKFGKLYETLHSKVHYHILVESEKIESA